VDGRLRRYYCITGTGSRQCGVRLRLVRRRFRLPLNGCTPVYECTCMKSVERQVNRLVRSWPIPDRVERGDEIVGTTLDLVPDGATRIPVALALNLVMGGLSARWRMRPPLFRWLHYRMGGRLPSRWHRGWSTISLVPVGGGAWW